MRPDVVRFGEAIPVTAIEAADAACNDCDLFLSIGTAAEVWPAAGLGGIARANGACLAEINRDATPLSGHCDFCRALPAGAALLKLLDCVGRAAGR